MKWVAMGQMLSGLNIISCRYVQGLCHALVYLK